MTSKEQRKELNQEWHKVNRDKSVDRHRAYREADPEKYRRLNIQWREKNKERRKEINAAYRKRNRARLREEHRKWKGLPEPTRPSPEHCELCGDAAGDIALSLDHCHESGKFRGWLCFRCNAGIGFFRDNTAFLEKAIAYLKGDVGHV